MEKRQDSETTIQAKGDANQKEDNGEGWKGLKGSEKD